MSFDDDHSDEYEGSIKPFSLANILFGNIDEDGQLEGDYLDADAKQHLGSLVRSSRTLNSLANDIRDDTGEDRAADVDDEGLVSASPNAVDYYDTDDVAVEERSGDATVRSPQQTKSLSTDNGVPLSSASSTASPESDIYAAFDEPISATVHALVDKVCENDPHGVPLPISPSTADTSDPTAVAVASILEQSASKSSLNTPLASVLPPELANIKINDIFPEFQPDVVLRFSRLFGPGRPSSLPKRWTSYRRKGELLSPGVPVEEETAEEDDAARLERLCNEFWPISLPKPVPKVVPIEVVPELPVVVESMADVSMESVESEKPKRLTVEAIPPWRYGPAQHWYDALNVDPTGENFDYGASTRKRDSRPAPIPVYNGSRGNSKLEVNDEAFLMISLTNWEQNIIWDGTLFKRDVDKLMSEKRTEAGWIPNTTYRTAAAFLSHGKTANGQQAAPLDLRKESMFPAVNDDLISGNWEKHIIWDADNIDDLPEPAVLTLDPNDPNIILEIPDEEECETMVPEPVVAQTKEKKDMQKRSRMVMGKVGMLKEPESPKTLEEPKNQFKDPFNLSNDEYYTLKTDEGHLKPTTGAMAIQHSIPSLQMYQYFFPTNISLSKNRQFHRNALKKYSNGVIITPGPHPVESLNRNIKKKEKQRLQEVTASGGGEMFFMRTPEDLSAQDGEMVLAEYTEEYPPLISQIGMATRIKNYYKRKPGKNEEELPKFEFGELAFAYTSPFLGDLDQGQILQTFENNMFRAPIYQHATPVTDFLVIRTRNRYYIRDIRVTFTVGQECPLMEVPAPNSKKATNFARDFLQVHIYRLFWKSADTPKRIKADDVKKLSVASSESSVRKRLKLCATFQRSGSDSLWWMLKPDFRLPSEEEIRALVSCEDYCAYYSMRAAEQRLKDAGYGEKLILATEDDGDEEQQSKMDDEIKAAPWNTTRAFIAAMKNKCILQVTGDADPTGRGEGFSYVRINNKIQEKDGPAPPKRIVTGTNADLRKLSLQKATELLRKFGCHDDQIKKLSRWEVIDLVRTLGTQQARAGNEEEMSKFARGSRYSAQEQQEKYKEDCQRIFKLQNRVLASEEVLSTDEESSEEEEDSDIEELGRNLDSFIQSKKTSKELLLEREEEERKELKKLLSQEEAAAKVKQKKKAGKKKNAGEEESKEAEEGPPQPVRKLKIVRTFKDVDGREFDRTEYVSRPALIDAYMRLKDTMDEDLIKQFASLDSEKKDVMRKDKKRLQLRKAKAAEPNDEVDATTSDGAGPSTSRKPKKDNISKVRCSACGGVGHMRSNKICPKAGESFNVAMTKEQEDLQFGNAIEDSGLVKVEGAKITLKKEVLNQTEMIRKKALIVKIPKTLADSRDLDKIESKEARKERKEREKLEGKRKRKESMPDYLEKPRLTTARRRIDPVVSLASMLEDILNEIRDLPGCDDFRAPVSSKKNPYYLTKITTPMDLSTMRRKLNAGQYKSREDFLADVSLIVSNCATYNGPEHALTVSAKKMLDTCLQRFGEREERFKKLEKLINPLLDEDDQVALNYLFQQIIETRLKTVEKSVIFHTPVNRTRNKDYYEFIKNPMDFDTMLQKAKSATYRSMEQFLGDVELIYRNCVQYNGETSEYTRVAEEIVRVAKRAVEEEAGRVAGLEAGAAADRDAMETESVGTESEGREGKKLDGMSLLGDLEDSTRASAMSDMGDDEVIQDTPASPDGSLSDTRDVFAPSDDLRPEMEDDETGSKITDTPTSPPAPQKLTRLSMVSTYYEDARTGYDDESDHGDALMDVDGDEQRVKAEEHSLQPSTSAPVAVEVLAKDLDVSDSESEGGEKPGTVEKTNVSHADEDDDGLWF
ncbi:transcription initiation factor TFIID subunit 1-like [Paramacrobiotus metropolitanus]|uniref:transcription initiation factor TFIID subunit 1-like n=1 Tax=Paramacrobiotus metropolitanus TaxID=2943436 RepID=UPI0024456A8B|nr:transcription initiation factor TFIID subunit 1-like [Paramacrobiotus metropolitanus]